MIDEKYSFDEFSKMTIAPLESSALSEKLAAEIQKELHSVVSLKLEEIVSRLNLMGHNLRFYMDPVPGDISYRDDSRNNGSYNCNLRLGVDTVVSVGFNDIINS
jgi:hypothetical protein